MISGVERVVTVHVDAPQHVRICVQTTVRELGDIPFIPHKRGHSTIAATVHHTLCIESERMVGL